MLKNTPNQYGSLLKFLHWTLVVFIVIQLLTILFTNYILEPKSPIGSFLIANIHMPVGALTLVFALIAIAWQAINIHPIFPESMRFWEKKLARLVHALLYICLIIMPVSGAVMTTANGHPLKLFGLYQTPQWIEKNKALADFFFEIHKITALILIGLVILHTFAALKHHFYDRDDVLKRML
jgi:cytochrome b561